MLHDKRNIATLIFNAQIAMHALVHNYGANPRNCGHPNCLQNQSPQQNAPQIITTTSNSSTNEQQSKKLLSTPMKPQQKSKSNLMEISAASSSSPTKLATMAENEQKVIPATSTNCLQNGSHCRQIHELFVELCLTVPVRLSTLSPYLPMLMDPLVCALNGSPTLVQQGLRTLELCVDNLQPDYFYEQMQPVGAALMKGLWHCVSTGESQFALIAIRILGKFGNTSRKVLMDDQTMECRLIKRDQGKGPKLLAAFPSTIKLETEEENTQMVERMSLGDAEEMMAMTAVEKSIGSVNASFPLDGCVQSAIAILRTTSPSDASPQQSSTSAASSHSGSSKMQACKFIKTLLVGLIPPSQMCSESALAVAKLIQADGTTFSNYICADSASRQTTISALNGLFIAVFNVETRQQILPFFRALIKHLTIQCVLESTAEDFATQEDRETVHFDSLVLIDAIALTLSDSGKDYCHTAILALRLLIDAASSLFNNDSVLSFLDRCNYVISCLSGELSRGTFDFASKSIDLIVSICSYKGRSLADSANLAHFPQQ